MKIFTLLIVGLLGAVPAHAEDVARVRDYVLTPDTSILEVLVRYDRGSLIAGHDHIARAKTFTGTVTWDDTDVTRCRINIQFPVSALVIDPPGSRQRYELEGTTSEGDKRKITQNMLGKHVLNAASFADISFTSTACKPAGSKVAVMGTLSIHGVGAEVTANMRVSATAEAFSAKGEFKATHGTFGMKPFTALMGSLRNDDGLTFFVDVKGTPK